MLNNSTTLICEMHWGGAKLFYQIWGSDYMILKVTLLFYKVKRKSSGPALTLLLELESGINIDVDLVPVFRWISDRNETQIS